MDTWYIDTDTLGPLRLRRAPTVVATRDGEIIPDRNTHEPIYVGELIVPGASEGRGGPTTARGIRVRFLAAPPPGLEDGQMVELDGKVTVTSWYRPGERRGDNGSSEITISPEVMRPTSQPARVGILRGLLPLLSPSPGKLPWFLMDVYQREFSDGLTALVVTPLDTVNDGTIEVTVLTAPDMDLIDKPCQLADIRGRIVIPDHRNVGRTTRSEMVVTVGSIVAHQALASVGNGSPPRARPTPTPAQPTGDES